VGDGQEAERRHANRRPLHGPRTSGERLQHPRNLSIMTSRTDRFCFVACLAVCCASAPASAQTIEALLKDYGSQNWRRDVEGPVLSLGEAGEFDDTHLLSPCVA